MFKLKCEKRKLLLFWVEIHSTCILPFFIKFHIRNYFSVLHVNDTNNVYFSKIVYRKYTLRIKELKTQHEHTSA